MGDIARVAHELRVHPNTIRYRLAKLRRLYGSALDDPDARFEIELVLRATATGVNRSSARKSAATHTPLGQPEGPRRAPPG